MAGTVRSRTSTPPRPGSRRAAAPREATGPDVGQCVLGRGLPKHRRRALAAGWQSMLQQSAGSGMRRSRGPARSCPSNRTPRSTWCPERAANACMGRDAPRCKACNLLRECVAALP